MTLEAINHAGYLSKTNLLVVLNDNEMSISPNVGRFPATSINYGSALQREEREALRETLGLPSYNRY